MKKRVLSLSLLTLLCLAVGLSAAPAPTDQPAAPATEAAPAPEVNAPAADQAPPVCEAGPGMFIPNYCGDPCSPNGSQTGCIDTSGPHWVRTICTCLNGHLVC